MAQKPEHIMRKAGLDESPVGIKISGRNINNLRYADDTTLMAESEEELKSFLMQVKEGSTKVGLKLNITKIKIMASGPITSWQKDGEEMEAVTDFIFLSSKITADGDCSQEIKGCLLLGRKAMANLDSILKSRDFTLPTKKAFHSKGGNVQKKQWDNMEVDENNLFVKKRVYSDKQFPLNCIHSVRIALKDEGLSKKKVVEVIGLDAMILIFLMFSFKPTFAISSFTIIKNGEMGEEEKMTTPGDDSWTVTKAGWKKLQYCVLRLLPHCTVLQYQGSTEDNSLEKIPKSLASHTVARKRKEEVKQGQHFNIPRILEEMWPGEHIRKAMPGQAKGPSELLQPADHFCCPSTSRTFQDQTVDSMRSALLGEAIASRAGVSNSRPMGQLLGRAGHGGGALRPSKPRQHLGQPQDERPTTTAACLWTIVQPKGKVPFSSRFGASSIGREHGLTHRAVVKAKTKRRDEISQ
ncbi:putative uncharacterized transposon-derived protein F52C9.6, partial [Varanus komodoensis]